MNLGSLMRWIALSNKAMYSVITFGGSPKPPIVFRVTSNMNCLCTPSEEFIQETRQTNEARDSETTIYLHVELRMPVHNFDGLRRLMTALPSPC